VSEWGPRAAKEAALREIEEHLSVDPDLLSLRFDRACIWDELDRIDDAKNGYLDVLQRQADHFGAMNNLGTLLYRLGMKLEACAIYAEAIRRHPENPIAYINLANAYVALSQLHAAKQMYEFAIERDRENHTAHQGLGDVLSRLGDEDAAAPHREKAFKHRPVTVSTYYGEGAPIDVLLLFSAIGGNLFAEDFFDPRVFRQHRLAVEFFNNEAPLPPHAIVFNSIGDADRCAYALSLAAAIVARTEAPVINPVLAVLASTRVENARRFGVLDGVIAPRTVLTARARLEGEDGIAHLQELGMRFPLLARAPGYHTGRHFLFIENPEALARQLSGLPGDDILLIEFVDTRGDDEKFRKYRVMFVDGSLYPLHAAISRHWKVHYFSAEMTSSAPHRAEDATFLNDMSAVVGPLGMRALEGIAEEAGLDYGGIDFGLAPDGRIVVFEANATMVVPQPPPGSEWDYRRDAVAQINNAVREMVRSRARVPT